MRRLFIAAFAYLIVGLGAGLFYREFTKANNFPEGAYSQLNTLHTHFLALGVLVLLIVLVLEKVFQLSQSKLFNWFFWVYNAALVITGAMMAWHGSLTVLGRESSKMISGIAGLGHMLMTVGFVLLFLCLGKALKREPNAAGV